MLDVQQCDEGDLMSNEEKMYLHKIQLTVDLQRVNMNQTFHHNV